LPIASLESFGGSERGREMSETRPVPRRESPWGTPEEAHRQPKAHRCNDRAEDVIQVNLILLNQNLPFAYTFVNFFTYSLTDLQKSYTF
jgi:hypothetical protein